MIYLIVFVVVVLIWMYSKPIKELITKREIELPDISAMKVLNICCIMGSLILIAWCGIKVANFDFSTAKNFVVAACTIFGFFTVTGFVEAAVWGGGEDFSVFLTIFLTAMISSAVIAGIILVAAVSMPLAVVTTMVLAGAVLMTYKNYYE